MIFHLIALSMLSAHIGPGGERGSHCISSRAEKEHQRGYYWPLLALLLPIEIFIVDVYESRPEFSQAQWGLAYEVERIPQEQVLMTFFWKVLEKAETFSIEEHEALKDDKNQNVSLESTAISPFRHRINKKWGIRSSTTQQSSQSVLNLKSASNSCKCALKYSLFHLPSRSLWIELNSPMNKREKVLSSPSKMKRNEKSGIVYFLKAKVEKFLCIEIWDFWGMLINYVPN